MISPTASDNRRSAGSAALSPAIGTTDVADSGSADGKHFLRRIARLAGPYWRSEQKTKVRAYTLLLVLLTVAQVGLAIWTNYWNRALFDALEERSLTAFLLQIGTFVIIFLLTMAVTAFHLRVKRYLQIGWRQWLTERLVNRWMEHGRHYQLVYTPGEHDNPDGRIAEDIRIATETSIAIGHTLLYSLLILGSFIDILWSVSGAANVPGTSVSVPGYMVVLAFAYAAVGTVSGWLVGRPLIRSTNKLQTAEADFRFGLAHARENSEAIALMHGESVERRHSSRLFEAVKAVWNRQTIDFTWLVSFSNGYGTLLPVFPILVAAPQYIAGTMTLGVLMQSAQAFQRLTSALSWPIDNLGDMAKCKASADRLLSLYDDLNQLEAHIAQADTHRIGIGKAATANLVLRDLCLANPDGRILLEGFNLDIRHGERVLIAGDPNVTNSLFKAIAGLWPWGHGQILLPRDQSIAFMPQRPFLPVGSLRSVLTYPAAPDHYTVQAIHYALECAGVAWLAPRLGDTDAWDRLLPLRAQQRLAFARIFLQQPQWIFIEEATDALDPNGECCMMETLHHELPNATIITISFHAGLERHHGRKLVLNRHPGEKSLDAVQPALAAIKPARAQAL